MMVVFTPFSFFFLSLNVLMVFLMVFMSDFYMYWVIMELSTLVFMGVSYSVFKNSFSFLMVFFIIQSVAAFFLLIFYMWGYKYAFSVSLLLKLSMFPFHFWFLQLVSFFPNFIFFLSSTLFKLPSIFILGLFSECLSISVILGSSIITLLMGGVLMLFSMDLRFLMLCSSVANNSWLVVSQYFGGFIVFGVFMVIYSFFLLLILKVIGGLMSVGFLTMTTTMGSSSDQKLFLFFLLLNLSGLPPFLLFFAKMIVVYCMVLSASMIFTLFFVLFSLILLVGYLKFSFIYLMSLFQTSIQFSL